MWVTHSVQLIALNYGLCIASCTLFGGDKLCHKLVQMYLFRKLATWYWSTNRYASFEMERNNFLNSRQRTETQNSKHWRNGFPDRFTPSVSVNAESMLRWCLQYSFHWKEWSKMESLQNLLQAILEWRFVSIDFSESCIVRIIVALTLHWCWRLM